MPGFENKSGLLPGFEMGVIDFLGEIFAFGQFLVKKSGLLPGFENKSGQRKNVKNGLKSAKKGQKRGKKGCFWGIFEVF